MSHFVPTTSYKNEPPMAAVSVTPIVLDRAVVAPSMPSMSVGSADIMYVPIAPTLPSPMPALSRF